MEMYSLTYLKKIVKSAYERDRFWKSFNLKTLVYLKSRWDFYEDDGYETGDDPEMQAVEVPEQYICELCRRTCKNQRGLKVHQASCRKKLRID